MIAINFIPNINGSVPTTASVTFVPSPVVSPKSVVAGNYSDTPAKGTCVVTNTALQIGRTESLFYCTDDYGSPFSMAVVNGAVDSGHPFYNQLNKASIDKRTDKADYYWGIRTDSSGSHGLGGCTSYNGSIVGVQQVATSLVYSVFDGYSGSFGCSGRIVHN